MRFAVLGPALALAAVMSWDTRGTAQERVRPPEAVACDRSQLTLYAGRVTEYVREEREVRVTIQTDWDTRERVTLRASGEKRLEDSMLLRGQRFDVKDWAVIESGPARLRPGVRLNAWICEGPVAPLLDWQPPE